jgi:uncharacterized protein YfiM (DUF2279 family)
MPICLRNAKLLLGVYSGVVKRAKLRVRHWKALPARQAASREAQAALDRTASEARQEVAADIGLMASFSGTTLPHIRQSAEAGESWLRAEMRLWQDIGGQTHTTARPAHAAPRRPGASPEAERLAYLTLTAEIGELLESERAWLRAVDEQASRQATSRALRFHRIRRDLRLGQAGLLLGLLLLLAYAHLVRLSLPHR